MPFIKTLRIRIGDKTNTDLQTAHKLGDITNACVYFS